MYIEDAAPSTPRLWFGKHRGKPLSEIDTGYLQWALRTAKLASGIRQAVEAELRKRGASVPPPPPRPRPGWMGPCDRCKSPAVGYRWYQYRDGQRNVEAFCLDCGRKLGIAPRISPYVEEADRAALEQLRQATAAERFVDLVVLVEGRRPDDKGPPIAPWRAAAR
jgi:hypothetical protein